MPVSSLLLRLHLVVVLAFLLFFALKAGLLLLGRAEALRSLRARTRLADSLLGLLILVTGGTLLAQYPGTAPGWLWTKLALVLLLLPLGIAAMRRQHKAGVVLTLLGFLYVYGLAETGSLTLQRPAAPAAAALPGLAETTATPDAAVPIEDTTAHHTTGLSDTDAATIAAASPPAPETATPAAASAKPVLAAGKALFAQNCEVCHGPDGKRGLNGAHDLTKSNLNTAGRVYMVTQGLGKMPGFKGQLTEAQIQEVVAYSLTLR
ncbi:c-type cytochrome [Hymenobacter psychrotolerans]|uniref:Invasion gene expression up-regulator, SirB n=1 Tax=Hymenobacter psychrotolerans DSM 18569 TaxID=1121959 RepID=A0A1M7BVP6_9BACT|nr:cytochrome c [Hymenobacter psychrotolerans]SHL59105.1 Invasion gene expression up-regulator, SirB [Hymenobacter psychrotolerans DSM 18569]